jgi:hypothetical protein
MRGDPAALPAHGQPVITEVAANRIPVPGIGRWHHHLQPLSWRPCGQITGQDPLPLAAQALQEERDGVRRGQVLEYLRSARAAHGNGGVGRGTHPGREQQSPECQHLVREPHHSVNVFHYPIMRRRSDIPGKPGYCAGPGTGRRAGRVRPRSFITRTIASRMYLYFPVSGASSRRHPLRCHQYHSTARTALTLAAALAIQDHAIRSISACMIAVPHQ